MDKDKFETMMHRAQKAPISEINGCITCKLCKGYFVDATTIIECLHTFCRSCIVRYLESNKYCPICDVQVHKTKPLLSIRKDKTIQDLVYKLVPRLYQNEAKRRKIFYEANPSSKPSAFEECTASQYENILAPDEAINLTLNYYGCSSAPRYLRCPSAVSITHLKKLIQAKYELTDHHKVDVFYNQNILNPSLSLMDVAYIYSWKKKEPLDLTYKIYECRAKKLKLDCTENSDSNVNKSINNNNNWKEVQLRISENGEMSITGIQDASMLELLDATENFKSEIVINESKNMDTFPKPVQVDNEIGNSEVRIQPAHTVDVHLKATSLEKQIPASTSEPSLVQQPIENHVPVSKKEIPNLKFIGKSHSGSSSILTNAKPVANTKLLNSGIKMVINNAKSGASVTKITSGVSLEAKKSISIASTSNSDSSKAAVSPAATSGKSVTPKSSRISITDCKAPKNSIPFSSAMPRSIELSETLNLNSELSVIPLNANAGCVSLSSCGTTTVFSTINKSMCSTKSDETYNRILGMVEGNENKVTIDIEKEVQVNNISKESNSLKRKCEETEKSSEVPAKLPKPTILNHSIGLMNLSNNHPLKKHSKMNRNGERRNPEITEKIPISTPSLTVSHVSVSQKPTSLDSTSKPVIINRNLNYLQLNRSGTPKLTIGQKGSSGNVPCYMPKANLNSLTSKVAEKNGEKFEITQEKAEAPVSSHNAAPKSSAPHSHLHTYQNTHHAPIITPAQLPHHQNLNSLQLKQTATASTKDAVDKQEVEHVKTSQGTFQTNSASMTTESKPQCSQSNTQNSLGAGPLKATQKCSDNKAESPVQAQATSVARSMSQNQMVDSVASSSGLTATSSTAVTQILTTVPTSSLSTTIKVKPSTPIGYKTLRDPPKSWNSQINSQIARVNQNVKAQQLANAAAAAASQAGGANAQGRYGGDLKSVRPAKFFKGRNMPRYLGNPASGVKPMYQVHVSPEKDKNQEQHMQNMKAEKSEIKKHSIVKIDPKTLKPISEKAPETSNLSNISTSLGLNVAQNSQELRINPSSGDLKINTSSVSIFNPLKLQQNSPKNERKSPKSPHSPKVKSSTSTTSSAGVTTSASSNSSSPVNTLSPKQQRDKTSLTFTPPNPFVPNLASPTLNPNQFLYPAGGFPSYDPRFMAACHSLWYTQRMAAAAAAGLVPPPLPHAFGLNIGLNPATTIGQQPHSPGVSSKHPASAKSSGQSSPRTSSTTTSLASNSLPTPNKKIKEPSAFKNEKRLEIALEKLTQNKVKELHVNKFLPQGNKDIATRKDVRNGSPLHAAQKTTLSKEPSAISNTFVGENCRVDTQQKKMHAKDVGVSMSALEKLSQNKSIEILSTTCNASGTNSSLTQEQDGTNSSVVSSGSKSGSGENQLVAGKDEVSKGGSIHPINEQSTNLAEVAVKPQSPTVEKDDGQRPDSNKTLESSTSPENPKKQLPNDKEQKGLDTTQRESKDNSKTENKSPTSTEIQRRLGQSENNSERLQTSCNGGKNVMKTDSNSANDSSSKSATTSDKDSDQKQSAPENNHNHCLNSCDNPGDLTAKVTSDTDTEKPNSEPTKCDNTATGDKKLIDASGTIDNTANETSFSDVASGKTSVREVSTDDVINSQPEHKDTGASDKALARSAVVESDSGGGEKFNSV